MKVMTDLLKLLLAVIVLVCMVVVMPIAMAVGYLSKGLQAAFYWCLGRDKEGNLK